MRHMQTLDLCDDLTNRGDQARLLEQLSAVEHAGTMSSWSDEHELQMLMLRYEASNVSVARRWFTGR